MPEAAEGSDCVSRQLEFVYSAVRFALGLLCVTMERIRKCILKFLLLEELEDDDILETLCCPRKVIHPMYKSRQDEGYFKNLINNYLKQDEHKFAESFRLSKAQFDFVFR